MTGDGPDAAGARPQPLSDLDQRELARIVGKHDSGLLDLVYGAINHRLLSDDEHIALLTALAVDPDDPDADDAERLAGILTHTPSDTSHPIPQTHPCPGD